LQKLLLKIFRRGSRDEVEARFPPNSLVSQAKGFIYFNLLYKAIKYIVNNSPKLLGVSLYNMP